MLYYLLDEELNIISVIENYKSAIWTRRYYSEGDCELYLPAETESIQLIKQDYFIVRDSDWQGMIVKNIQITTSAEEGNYIIVTGKSLQSILNRRVIYPLTTIEDTSVESCIRELITQTIINPDIAARAISNFILGDELGIETEAISVQYIGEYLGDVVSSLCTTYSLGYDVRLDIDNKQFIFALYKGTDRSYNQSENPYVVFSHEYENLLTSNYVQNADNYKNVAVVAGEGEGIKRTIAESGDAEGLSRYELFVDAKDISSAAENGKILSATKYKKLLVQRGTEELSMTTVTEAIEGEIINNFNFVVDRDYYLGDIVEVINEYGVEMFARIIEVIESEDDTGTNVVVAFETTE